MNILPKKRWHVRTKDNIARVRRDEAEAAEKEKERQRRILLAEQESRTDFLRKKAKPDQIPDDQPFKSSAGKEVSIVQNGHINFFQDIEKDGGYVGGVNKEHEEEKKAEQEKYEKNIGLLSYLGQGSTEASGTLPWYLKSHDERVHASESIEEENKAKKGHRSKSSLDPMNEMKQYMELSFGKPAEDKTKKSEKKTQKDEKKSKGKTSIEKLREERLKREKEEREKARKLLERLKGGPPKAAIQVDERQNRYNSQFNPELARQNYIAAKEAYFK